MATYLTLDGGTTNTRLYLVEDGRITHSLALPVGVGRTEGDVYRRTLLQGAERALFEWEVSPDRITAFLASGMVTSERGLSEVPHLPCPAGLCELHRGLVPVSFPELSFPVTLIPGVKKAGMIAEATDMMRGEETEVMGLGAEGIVILPGSHNKVIRVEGGRILDFVTLMTGEMIAALTGHTILSHAVTLEAESDPFSLVRGAKAAERLGLAAALFKTRILATQFAATPEETLGYFLGCLLSEEVRAVEKMAPRKKTPVTVAGKAALKRPLALLLRERGFAVTEADEEAVASATALGAVRIFEGE